MSICSENLTPDYYTYSGYTGSIASKIEIRISCKDLPNLDTFSKSDPKVFVFLEQKVMENGMEKSKWTKVGSTERIKNNLNPVFVKSFIIDYYFELIQKLRFVVFDMDSKSENFQDNDYIGYIEKTVGDLISSSVDNVYTCDLLSSIPDGIKINNNKTRLHPRPSKISINIEEIQDVNRIINVDIYGTKLDKMDLFGKSDPFFKISKSQENGTWLKVYESSVIKNTLNPVWKSLTFKESILNNGDSQRMLLWEFFDWDRNSSPDYIGSFEASVAMLENDISFKIVNQKKLEKSKKKNKKYTDSGTITFKNLLITKEYSFLEFPMNGTEIKVIYGIDFTSSNGEKTYPQSLHYLSPTCDLNNFSTLNEYQKAISAIGYVLEPYDTTKYMAVYGYGGKFFNSGRVDFCCPLTNNPENPYVYGVDGILAAYSAALNTVQLWGPTNFSPIIKRIADIARSSLPPRGCNSPLEQYYILTIITDGDISDMEETKKAIINSADLPLSIIIIGVGNSRFESMIELDGDDTRISYGGKYAERDIVQFVPLSNYISNPSLLATETLAEIPKQVTEFASKYKYKPRFG